jgi:hypothetical protein
LEYAIRRQRLYRGASYQRSAQGCLPVALMGIEFI